MNKYDIYFAVNNKKQLNKILSLSAVAFNGYTLTKCQGGWKDDTGKLIKENSYQLTIIADDSKEKEVELLPKYINWIAEQDCSILISAMNISKTAVQFITKTKTELISDKSDKN
tara:strand:+ start:1172 stop:1513 length:342 start_codon:yes stop_codon:yes gene_type:complete